MCPTLDLTKDSVENVLIYDLHDLCINVMKPHQVLDHAPKGQLIHDVSMMYRS